MFKSSDQRQIGKMKNIKEKTDKYDIRIQLLCKHTIKKERKLMTHREKTFTVHLINQQLDSEYNIYKSIRKDTIQ